MQLSHPHEESGLCTFCLGHLAHVEHFGAFLVHGVILRLAHFAQQSLMNASAVTL